MASNAQKVNNKKSKCPTDSFCAIKTGELCVYGLDQFSHMTQIKAEDLGIEGKPKHNLYSYGIAFAIGFFVAFLILIVKRIQKKVF